MDYIYTQIIEGLQKYCEAHHINKVVVGLSGGVDSSLTLKLAVDALSARRVTAIIMPDIGVSSNESIDHAQKLAEFLGVKCFKIPLNPYLVDFTHLPWRASPHAYANTKARMRMILLYNYANSFSALVLGTSNKSEILLGYGTKYGDLAADIEVIGDLYKTEVWELADFVGLPPEIIEKAPTAELTVGQTDEQELGGTYHEIDPILKQHSIGINQLISKGMNPTLVRQVLNLIKKNEHKREMPPVIAVTRRGY